MQSLADSPELVGFFSYAREDDEDSKGALSALRDRIQRELRGQLGRSPRDFRLWQDKEAIAPGTMWASEISTAVAQSVFFIPIITPTAVRSAYCRHEFESFLAREQAIGRSDLVFPLLYIRVAGLENSTVAEADPVLSIIAARQYVDWREFRHRDVYSTPVSEAIERLCRNIVDALTRPDPSETEQERQRREAESDRLAEAQRQAELAERQRHEEAEQKRQQAQVRRESDAAKAAEERRQAEAEQQRQQARARQKAEAARLAEQQRQKEAEEQRQRDAEQQAQAAHGPTQTPPTDLERRTLAKITRRLVPVLFACYFIAYLDRINPSYGAVGMISQMAFSASIFGSAATVFLVGFVLCMVPANLLLLRFGARRWIASLMLAVGLLTGAMASIQGASGFLFLRFLSGAAQAGIAPGMIFYLTLWFPPAYRARGFAYVLVASLAAALIGGPISIMLMELDGAAGLRGWQWLFILEGLPAIVLAGVALRHLADRPGDANWLAQDERDWLRARLGSEQSQQQTMSVPQTLANPKVLLLSVVYFAAFAMSADIYATLPLIIRALGVVNTQTVFVFAIPSVAGVIGMLWCGRHSDLQGERRRHLAIALAVAAVSLGVSALFTDPVMRLILASVSILGVYAAQPVFWTLPPALLTGASAAVGIAVINALGGLASLIVPPVDAMIRSGTAATGIGPLLVAVLGMVATILVLSRRSLAPD